MLPTYEDIWHPKEQNIIMTSGTLLKVSLSIVVVCAYIYIIYAHATIKLLFVEEFSIVQTIYIYILYNVPMQSVTIYKIRY